MDQTAKTPQHLYHYLIDEYGNWYCEGNPVTDRDVFKVLSRSLHQLETGGYVIRCEGEEHPVEVLDAPLFVHCVHVREDPDGALLSVDIELADKRREPLAAETLAAPNNNSLYCLATSRRLRAKFEKLAYYELTRYLQMDDATGRFYFVIGDRRFDIAPGL